MKSHCIMHTLCIVHVQPVEDHTVCLYSCLVLSSSNMYVSNRQAIERLHSTTNLVAILVYLSKEYSLVLVHQSIAAVMSDVNALYYFMNKALHHVIISFRWQVNFCPAIFVNPYFQVARKQRSQLKSLVF